MIDLFSAVAAIDVATLHASAMLASGSSSSSDGGIYLLLLGPLAGVGFYTFVYLRYRNTDKRFEYEHHTQSEVLDPRGGDQKVDTIRGTSKRRIDGDNSGKPRQRLGRGTTMRNSE